MANESIIIGIDPGTRITGYGIVKLSGSSFIPVDFGCIRPPAELLLSDRYAIIFNALDELIKKYTPSVMAVETPFVQKNAQSALKLGIALGCALLAAKQNTLAVHGYSPRQVKCAIVGTGKATKEQMLLTVSRFLSLQNAPKPQDAADALGVALCHATYPKSVFSKGNREL